MLNLWKKFMEGYDGDNEINFDDDVPPHIIPKKEPTMQEQMNEVMFKLGRIEAKLEMLCKSK
jgi:hypothetical protein